MSTGALIKNARPDVVDQFGRTVASGWGSADTGQPWVLLNGVAGEYVVGSGIGSMDVTAANASRNMMITSMEPDFDVRCDVGIPVAPTGGDYNLFVRVRDSSDSSASYYVVANFATTGNVAVYSGERTASVDTNVMTVQAATPYTPGTFWRIRLRCIGSTIQAKAWLRGTAEPGAWVSFVDTTLTSGRLRLSTFRNSGNTSSDTRGLFDNFSVRALYPNVWDNFGRTVAAGSWGAANSGHGYTVSGIASDYSVSGGLGRITFSAANTNRLAYTAFQHTDVDATADVGVTQVQTGGNMTMNFRVRSSANGNDGYRCAATFTTAGTVSLDLTRDLGGVGTNLGTLMSTTYTPGLMFRFRIQCLGATIRAKAWALPGAEPVGWQVTATDSAVAQGVGITAASFRSSGNTSVDPTVLFDSFFVRPLRPGTNDDFNRTVASGWGNMTSGQAWINSDPAVMSVGSGRGVISPAANTIQCAALPAPAADMEARVIVDAAQAQTGANIGVRLFARASTSAANPSDRYYVETTFTPAGNASVNLVRLVSGSATTLATLMGSTAYTPGTGINLRLRCVGSKIMGKAWFVGSAEPAWTEVNDTSHVAAGFVQCNVFRANGNTSVDPRVFFDDFLVVDLGRPMKFDTSEVTQDPSRLVAI